MTDTQTPAATNGAAPAAPPPAAPGEIPGLPPGSIRLSPQTHAAVVRLIQDVPAIRDVLWAYLDAKEARGQYALVIPVILLVPPQEGQGG